MVDITMCSNEECPLGDQCYRRWAEPSDAQYSAHFDWFIVHEPEGVAPDCEHFYRR